MVGRRIVYGAAVCAVLALQIFYDGYLGQFLLVCAIALPLLSLALSLRGVLGVRLELTPSVPQLVQGQGGEWQISINSNSFVPVSRLTITLTLENSLTGTTYRERLRTSGLSGHIVRSLPIDGAYCGQLTCRLDRVRALDALGLFAFPVPVPKPVYTLVLPQPVPPEELPSLPQMPAGVCPGWGGSPSMEDYDLREYRPGDSLRTIHWKLSSKHDSLVVREPVKSGLPQVALTLDLFGDGARLNRVLGRLWSVSQALLDRDIPHKILWLDPACGQQEKTVASQDQLLGCMAALLSHPAPMQRPSATLSLSHLGQLPQLHITIGEEDAP